MPVRLERGRTSKIGSRPAETAVDAPRRKTSPSRATPRRADRYDAKSAPGEPPVRPVRGKQRPVASEPVTLTLRSRVEIEHALASGIAEIDKGLFAIVDDDKGVFFCRDDGSTEKVLSAKHDHRLRDLEGLCRSSDGKSLYAVVERECKVYRLPIERGRGQVTLGEPEKLGKLPRLNDPDLNKGWEGIDVMPGRWFGDGQDRLVAVNEGDPRRVGLFRLPDLDEPQLLKLPGKAKDHLLDLSDVAVDPRTGHLLVLSDQSSTIVEFALVNQRTLAPGKLLDASELKMLAVHPLETKKAEKPEGLTFDRDGNLWMSTDGKPGLYAFDVERPARN